MQRPFRPFRGFCIQTITLAVLIALFLTLQPHKAHAICDDPDAGGAIFYNFEEIVIYYAHFPSIDQQRIPGYPEDLKYDNFTKLLTDSIHDRFSKCLKTPSGGTKPITVINPHGAGCCTYEKLVERNRIYDPKTLTVVLSVTYMKGHHMTIDVEEYGHLTSMLYRPGLSDQQMFMLLEQNTAFATIFPKRGDQALREQIVTFLRRIRPINYPMPNPEQGRFLYKKDERK